MHQSNPRPTGIGEVIERWLLELGGPARLEAFHRLPECMQRGAWAGLRCQIEAEHDEERRAA